MPQTQQEIEQSILSQLKVLIPDLSVDPLTPEHKIISTVANIIADASIDPYVLNYQFDVDTKVGTDLDKFVAIFGFARQGGRAATGMVTFSRVAAAAQDIFIPVGATVTKPSTSVSGTVSFATTAPAVLPVGGNSVDVPIQCTDIGPIGNVAANTITVITGGATDISSVSNADATSRGTEQETDAELRIRFKNTIFRNVAGTRDQYLALAIATQFSNKANVIGSVSRFVEYLQIEPDLVINSIIPYSKYSYNFDYYLTNGDPSNEVFYAPNGVDFSFTASVPPVITVNNTANLPVGSVVLLEHAYCSSNSRNDPLNNIANYVDVYVTGQDAVGATETVSFPSSSANFVNTTGLYDIHRFVRIKTNAQPVVGNRFQELIWQPIYDIPDIITINGVDYYEGTHYWQIRDITNYKGSKRSRDGIEWNSSVTVSVPVGTTFTLAYTFNKLPLILNELMDNHKQIASDVLVHAATNRYFNVNFIVMYTPGFPKAAVDEALTTTLTQFFQSQQFGALLQISDILEIAHEVPGVDNIRLATPTDGVAYGIQEVAPDGTTILGAPNLNDFALQDSDLPVLNNVVTTQKSQNTW